MNEAIDTDLRGDVRALVSQVMVLSEEFGPELERSIRLAAQEPLADDEARVLFTRILTVIRGGLDEGLDDVRKAAIVAEVAGIVQEVIAHRALRRASSNSDGQELGEERSAPGDGATDHHLELFSWDGLPVRNVSPAPIYNGRTIPMLEGYVRTDDLRLWPENHRLELHVAEF